MNEPVAVELRAGCVQACPGCTHRLRSKAESEAVKTAHLKRTLSPWSEVMAPLRGVEDAKRWQYRDRSLLHAQWREDRWELGMLKRKPGQRETFLVPIPDCPVHSIRIRSEANRLISELKCAPPEITLFAVIFNGEFLSLVLKQRALSDKARTQLIDLADREGWNLWVHLHPSAGYRVTTAKPWIPVGKRAAAEPRVRDEEGFWYGPTSFRQALIQLHRDSMDEACRFLDIQSGDEVVDLYCGIGKTLAEWSRAGARAIGVEVSRASIELAQSNAPRATCLVGRVQDRVPQIQQWRSPGRTPLLYINPPRGGVEADLLSWFTDRLSPQRIAYLSCDPRTLARDLGILERDGYRVRKIIPYDFFPQTSHVETLALLDRGALR